MQARTDTRSQRMLAGTAIATHEPRDRARHTHRAGGNNLVRLIITMLLACIATATTATAAAAAQPASNGSPQPLIGGAFHWIRNAGNNLCLQPEAMSTAAGARIVQEPCATTGLQSVAQGWQSFQAGNNHYKFQNQLSGHCLDAIDDVAGAPVIQWPCATISNQEFNTGTSLPAVTKIESRIGWRDSRFCVDVPGNQNLPGLRMQMWGCNGTLAQIWVIGF